ncbi:MAG: hypothetical protein QM762_26465 [Chryseolinea sp.]
MEDTVVIAGDKKIGDRQLDLIIHRFLQVFNAAGGRRKRFVFDISQVQWISNQELLVLTGLFRYLYNSGIDFHVKFRSNQAQAESDVRRASQFIEIWEVWKIYKVIPEQEFGKYFDIDGRFIDALKTRFRIQSSHQDIYDRYGVTPFLELQRIQNYEDRLIVDQINAIYRLSEATNQVLRTHNCFVPIQNQTLGAIVTKELYENFLDHFSKSIFQADRDCAFMSISLHRKLPDDRHDAQKLQRLLKLNFEEEQLAEVKPFFVSTERQAFVNQSLLELSFLDFGEGIPVTLGSAYENDTNPGEFSALHHKQNLDTRILEYAFRFDSSQYPIHQRYSEELVLPRGLFDVLTIVKRFEGLLVARSNYGKVAFDFSANKDFKQSVVYFGDQNLFFPGTLISICLPERTIQKPFDSSKIKPIGNIVTETFVKRERKYLSVYRILSKLRSENLQKQELYDELLDVLSRELKQTNDQKEFLFYLDFEGYEIDKRISKKIIYYLISDYRVNFMTSVIIINPPHRDYLDHIQKELLALGDIDRQFKVHPTPFVYLNHDETSVSVYWLGVYSQRDVTKLNDLLLKEHDLRRSDFERPDDVVGNSNFYDVHGNLYSVINSAEIVNVYKSRISESRTLQVEELLGKYVRCVPGAIYLCNGNYYQEKYVQLFDALSNHEEREFLVRALYQSIVEKLGDTDDLKFLCITASSQKILDLLVNLGFVAPGSAISLDSYLGFIDEPQFEKGIVRDDRVVLVCDVVSTGYMIHQVQKGLDIRGALLAHVAVLVNAVDPTFAVDGIQYTDIAGNVSSLMQLPIPKVRRADIRGRLVDGSLRVIRINPFTNTPITDSIKNSNYDNSVLLSNREFVDIITPGDVKAGYFIFNNLIHPYFFDTESILKNDATAFRLLDTVFRRVDPALLERTEVIFYPKNSGIKFLNMKILTDQVLRNQRIKILELERFPTSEGWRFPHPPEFMKQVSEGKTVFILDDGSCTGDSIVQMIDEVAFLNVSEIVVLTLIGRVNNHKREFFSRIESISNASGGRINLKVLFGSHWNIPTYYVEESPVMREKRWLEDLCGFANTPFRIRDIANQVLHELKPKLVSGEGNQHLLKKRDGESIVSDLVIPREEIGKITSYRFYDEHFNFFNDVIAQYESDTRTNDRYRTIELICAVFLHEPYLFSRFKNVLPDLVDKLEEFVFALTIGNPKRGNRRIEKDGLYYDWKNKDIVHLFFIVFRDTRLIEVLNTDTLTGLIKRFGKSIGDLNYIFFKLIRYMPLRKEVITEKKYSGKIIRLIEGVRERVGDSKAQNQMKIVTSFLATLPFREDDFEAHLSRIKNNYVKLRADEFHNEYIFNDKQVVSGQLALLIKNRKNSVGFDEELKIIRSSWAPISVFVEDLLRFSRLYPGFFLPVREKTSGDFVSGISTLGETHNRLQHIFLSDDVGNVEDAPALLDKLFEDYIMEESPYFKVFNNISTPSVKDVLEEFVDGDESGVAIELSCAKDCSIDFPLYFFRELVIKEIFSNLRHANRAERVHIVCDKKLGILFIEVTNSSGNSFDLQGGGKGIERLKRLNAFPISTAFEVSRLGELFIQNFQFRAI